MKRLSLAALGSAVIALGCRDQQPLQPPAFERPSAVIMDGAHSGNADFFFLPPLVADPSGNPNFTPGKFNPGLSPVVEVCQLTGDPRGTAPVDCVAGGPVFGPAAMALDLTAEQYTLNWDTKSTLLVATNFYRILVRGARRGTVLGFVDIDPVDQGVKNLKTGEVVQFQDGRTLPIKVRIEQGAFGTTNPDHVEQIVRNVATTVTTNTGFAGAAFPDNWLPPAAVAAGIDQVVVIIERIPVNDATAGTSCLRSGLKELEGCYRFRTDPDLHEFGSFNNLVTAGVCVEIPEILHSGAPFQLQRRAEVEGAPSGPTVALVSREAAFLTCAGFTPTPPLPSVGLGRGALFEYASAGWRALVHGIGRLVRPRTLYAVDLGAGGGTDAFSRFGWARAATMVKVLATDGQTAVTGTKVFANPKVCLTSSHPVVAPLVAEPVTFSVTGGGGSIGGGSNAAVLTGADGCASAVWVLGLTNTSVGGNALAVTGAAMPSSVPFSATGVNLFASVSDALGDAATDARVVVSPDLAGASANAFAGKLQLSVTFAPGTLDPQTTLVQVLLDTDRNPATGNPGSDAGGVNDAGIIGVDYMVQMGATQATILHFTGTPNTFTPVGTVAVSTVSNLMVVEVPLSLLGDDDGQMNFKVTTFAQIGPAAVTGVLDYMPNVGSAPGALVITPPCIDCVR